MSFQIEQYRAEIKRLQESEAEIKALSKNYAALLKEKEVPLRALLSTDSAQFIPLFNFETGNQSCKSYSHAILDTKLPYMAFDI